MKLRASILALAASASSVLAADIVLTPPAGGGVAVTNAAGDTTRFRVADDGAITVGTSVTLVNSTAAAGNILKGGNRFIHNFGTNNTFIGENAGNFTMTGGFNTASGMQALFSNTDGIGNTASGRSALFSNTTGASNTASGFNALFSNTTGNFNTASGENALASNTTGSNNTASGVGALFLNTSGFENAAVGYAALAANTGGAGNTAVGYSALSSNAVSFNSTAVGAQALKNSTGAFNVALGAFAGFDLTTGDNNIAIAHSGVAGESVTTRLGSAQTRAFIAGVRGVTTGSNNAIPVLIDGNGQLGTASSSRRFKDDIADMGEASEGLMDLRPVTFTYRSDSDPSGRRVQYGLVAEEVAAVYPGLVARSPDGQVETVMYQFLPPMLLNEIQKQQRTIEAQVSVIEAQSARLESVEHELSAIRRALGLAR